MSDTVLPASSDTQTELRFGDKRYILIGTAHISQESVEEVGRVLETIKPERVCVELDQGRYASMNSDDAWKKLDIYKVIKEGKGFLLLANLMLSSFQKRLGTDTGTKPGAEMKEAIAKCQELNIPFSLIDREIQVTLRRAWVKSGFWGKNKLIAALLGSAFGGEEIDAAQIEELKKKSALQGMLDELSGYLPQVKTVLIDERDQYLAGKLYEQGEKLVVAVVGAGHVPGITRWLEELHRQNKPADLSEISTVPPSAPWGKILGWLLPVAIVALIGLGFINGGWQVGLDKLLTWVVVNGGLAALGTLVAFGHPLTVVAAFVGAPIATLNPFIGVGLITGMVEAFLRRPRVQDLENLSADVSSVRGFYRNRVTRILLVFILSSLGGMIGNFIAIPNLF